MATSDPETMWIKGQDQFGSVCWRNMKTFVIRYTDSRHKGLASGTHPNTPSIEFYPNSGCVEKKDAWKKLKDDEGNDYWYNTIMQEVWGISKKADTKTPSPPPVTTPSSPTKTSGPPGPPSSPEKTTSGPPGPPSSPKKKNKRKKGEKKGKKDAPSAPSGPPGPPGPPGAPSSTTSSSSAPSSSPSTPKYKKAEHELWSRQIDKDYGKVWYNEKTGKQQVARPDCLKKYK